MKKVTSKLVVLVLALALSMTMAFALAACGGDTSDSNSGSGSDATNSDTATVEEDATEEQADALGPHTLDMTSEELWASYKEFSSDKNLSDITLEALEDHLGVTAEKQESTSETNDQYFWHSNDGGGLIVLFNKETGKFTSASQAYPK
ncbi:MAG: hypothetical protein FWE41_06600 [Coriobacteriia bacterium]|nr:hypothetical protein [Coriobacteriia bacterium]MCL2750282.1 hypothetical protein [Coriobacteriia bacterium]